MILKSWKFWGALATAGVAAAVNFATEQKYNVLIWAAVFLLVVLTVWFESMADKGGRRRRPGRKAQDSPPVLHYEERSRDARRTVSTTSVEVATEFLKRIPLPVDPPHEPPKPLP